MFRPGGYLLSTLGYVISLHCCHYLHVYYDCYYLYAHYIQQVYSVLRSIVADILAFQEIVGDETGRTHTPIHYYVCTLLLGEPTSPPLLMFVDARFQIPVI